MLLQLQNVTFGFSPEKQIFKNLSFYVEKGKIYAILGANGSGKTTLFNLISGFHRLHSGNIVFKQQNITHTEKMTCWLNKAHIGKLLNIYENG